MTRIPSRVLEVKLTINAGQASAHRLMPRPNLLSQAASDGPACSCNSKNSSRPCPEPPASQSLHACFVPVLVQVAHQYWQRYLLLTTATCLAASPTLLVGKQLSSMAVDSTH